MRERLNGLSVSTPGFWWSYPNLWPTNASLGFSKHITSLVQAQVESSTHKIIFCFFSPCLQYSLCNEPLIELSNPGASGSVFYVTKDDEFIIKTVMHKEAEFLQKLLPGYYMVSMACRVGNATWVFGKLLVQRQSWEKYRSFLQINVLKHKQEQS